MATGKCVMYKDGKPYAVAVDDGVGNENQVDIDYYEGRGYQPSWQDLPPCGAESNAKDS
jgi:hypothetical protein